MIRKLIHAFRILTGQRNVPKICAAICEILDIKEED